MKIPKFLYVIYEQNQNREFCFSPGKGLKIYIDSGGYENDSDYEEEGDDTQKHAMQSRMLLYNRLIYNYDAGTLLYAYQTLYSAIYEPALGPKDKEQLFLNVGHDVSIMYLILFSDRTGCNYVSIFFNAKYLKYYEYRVESFRIKRFSLQKLLSKKFLQIDNENFYDSKSKDDEKYFSVTECRSSPVNLEFSVRVQKVIDVIEAAMLIQKLLRGLSARRTYQRLMGMKKQSKD